MFKKVQEIARKYPFPIPLFVLYDAFVSRCSALFSTWKVKTILKLLGCEYGHNLRANGRVIVRVHRKGAILLANNVTISSKFITNLAGITNPTVFCCIGEGKIAIGNNSGCTSTIFSSRSNIMVGQNVNIGANVRIYDHDYHPVDYLERREGNANVKSAPIIIGDDVFIGSNAIILKGVNIGDRSIVGAGAVVAHKNIPPDSLVVGNPAQIVSLLSREKAL